MLGAKRNERYNEMHLMSAYAEWHETHSNGLQDHVGQ